MYGGIEDAHKDSKIAPPETSTPWSSTSVSNINIFWRANVGTVSDIAIGSFVEMFKKTEVVVYFEIEQGCHDGHGESHVREEKGFHPFQQIRLHGWNNTLDPVGQMH